MAGSWPGLVLQLASLRSGERREDSGHESSPVRRGGPHEQCKQELYPDSGVTTTLATHCSLSLSSFFAFWVFWLRPVASLSSAVRCVSRLSALLTMRYISSVTAPPSLLRSARVSKVNCNATNFSSLSCRQSVRLYLIKEYLESPQKFYFCNYVVQQLCVITRYNQLLNNQLWILETEYLWWFYYCLLLQ